MHSEGLDISGPGLYHMQAIQDDEFDMMDDEDEDCDPIQ